MAKKNITTKDSVTPKTDMNASSSNTKSGFNNWIVYLCFALVIAFMYGKTLNYGFVLDDDLFIKNNPVMQDGLAAIPETFKHGSQEHFKGSNFQMYRPVVISAFLWQYQLFELDTKGYHMISLLLYFLIAVVLFKLLEKFLPSWNRVYLALIAILFLVHPVHSEVVANIKSQDELLASLFSLSALLLAYKHHETNKLQWFILACVSFFLALFSKESVVAFVAVFFVMYWLIIKMNLLQALRRTIPFIALGMLYILVRYAVLKEVAQGFETSAMENVLYAAKGFGEQLATRLTILLTYFRLMLYPVSLTWDYSYSQIPVTNLTSFTPYLSLLCILVCIGSFFFFWRKQPVISFGIALFAICLAPVSNIFFLNGTTLAERFLFLPSFGFILALVAIIFWIGNWNISPKINLIATSGLAIVIVVFTFMTSKVSATWVDNFTLFETAAQHAPNSTRVNAGYATELMNKAQATSNKAEQDSLVSASIGYFEKSLKLFPDNYQAAFKLGMIRSMQGDLEKAKSLYKQSIASHPDNVMALNNLGSLYAKSNLPDSAIFYFKKSLQLQENNELTLKNMVIAYSAKSQPEEVIRFASLYQRYGFNDPVVSNLMMQAQGKLK
ncbi:MAG: tetratricopeptide repeat protein [Chitinophagaceae bacterium]|nr:tetratricopeptide repeat protein [Chitinophagaceae bacterium]